MSRLASDLIAARHDTGLITQRQRSLAAGFCQVFLICSGHYQGAWSLGRLCLLGVFR
jgi:hypothetical protein